MSVNRESIVSAGDIYMIIPKQYKIDASYFITKKLYRGRLIEKKRIVDKDYRRLILPHQKISFPC